MKDAQLALLSHEETLLLSSTHPDYVSRIDAIESRFARKTRALEERVKLEGGRIEGGTRLDREEVGRWFVVGLLLCFPHPHFLWIA